MLGTVWLKKCYPLWHAQLKKSAARHNPRPTSGLGYDGHGMAQHGLCHGPCLAQPSPSLAYLLPQAPSPPHARLSSPSPMARGTALSFTRLSSPPGPITAPYSPLLSLAPMGSVSLKIGDGTAHFRHAIILREIEASESRLHRIEHDLAGYETLDPAKPVLPPELKLVLARHPLSLSRDFHSGITTMVSSVAHSCARPAAIALLSTFMSYHHATSCPTVDPLLSKLISKACEPLPSHHRPLPPPSPISLEDWNPNAKNLLPGSGSCLWAVSGWHAC